MHEFKFFLLLHLMSEKTTTRNKTEQFSITEEKVTAVYKLRFFYFFLTVDKGSLILTDLHY